MQIVTIPHPALKKKSVPVSSVDRKLISFIRDFEITLINKKDPEGVGLSAPQVGKNIRLFSTWLEWGDQRQIHTYINPVIVKHHKLSLGSNPDKPFLEGCLSIPDIYGPVYRYHVIKLEYQVINPQTMVLETESKRFESFPARVIQHEVDHLDGILFTERALEQQLPLYQEINGKLEALALPPK